MYRHILKQALCLLITLNLVLTSAPASADIGSAFQSLIHAGDEGANVAINKPGQFSSQSRNAFVAGGLDVRFPSRAAPQILNVTPFRFQAGCGGISLAFGGFSFISGDEIKNLIKSVAQNSVGMAVELVITTLCGPCASVMQVMRNLALAASKNSLDSCRIATTLVNGADSLIGGTNPKTNADSGGSICGLMASAFGASSDANAATSDCADIGNSIDKMTNMLNGAMSAAGISDPTQQQRALCAVGAECNTVWTLLNSVPVLADNGNDENLRTKLLLMNVLGTNVMIGHNTPPASSGGSGTPTSGGTTTFSNTPSDSSGSLANQASATAQVGPKTFEPLLGNVRGGEQGVDMSVVFKIFMCGTHGSSSNVSPIAQAAINWYCTPPADANGKALDLAQLPVWDCDQTGGLSGGSEYTKCLHPSQIPLQSSKLAGDGYLPMVANLLEQGVDAVRNNQPIDSAAPGLIGLIQGVPVPIYQAINAAAVYPDAGADLMSVMSVEVAELLTYSHLRDIVRTAGTFQAADLPPAQLDRIYTLLSGMRAGTMERRQQMLSQITLQSQMMEQIRQLNLAMQREVMTPELLGAHNYGVAVSNAASGSN